MRVLSHRRRAVDDGFTLIELMVAMMIFGLLAVLVVPAWKRYQAASEHQGTAEAVRGVLRNAQVHAVSEDRTYCVRFDTGGRTWSLWRGSCGSGTNVSTGSVQGSKTSLTSADFLQDDGTTHAPDAYFYPSGRATKGSISVVRSGSSKTYTVSVEGLTGRVSMA